MKEQLSKLSIDSQKSNHLTQNKGHNPFFDTSSSSSGEGVAQKKANPFFEETASNPFLNNPIGNPFLDKPVSNPFLAKPTNSSFPISTVQKKSIEKGDTQTNQVINHKKENNTGLPDNLKSGIENLSGYSMDDVNVHYNSHKPAQLQAQAYAQGTDIHLGAGQEKHLAHEAWHVVQQKQGRVKPTLQVKGRVNINDDERLEKEADQQGAKAANVQPVTQNRLKTQSQNAASSSNTSQAPVQGFFGNLVKKGLGFLKSKVVDMIPQEYKDMIPPEIRNLADQMTDKGIDMAGNFAEEKGMELANKAKSKLAEAMPPQLVELANKMPPELRTYLEGLLEKGGQLAKGSLGEGRLPTKDELSNFGKDAATGGIDVAKEMVPKAIPDDIKDLINKLPPEVKAFGEKQVEKGIGSIKDGIQNGEMPDIKAFGEEALNEGKEVGKKVITDAAKEKVTEYLGKMPPDVKDIILELIPAKEKAAIL